MNRPNPTQNPLSQNPRAASNDAPALSAGTNSAANPVSNDAPLRGEIFEAPALMRDHEVEPAASKSWHPGWLAAGAAFLFCTYTFGAYVGQKSKVPTAIGPFSSQSASGAPVVVHIVGRVKRPGVYKLKSGARLQDAIQKAGGALPGADLGALNLADWAADGSKIEIPARQSKPTATATPTIIIKEVFVTPPQNAPEPAENRAPTVAPALSKPPKTATRGSAKPTDDGIPRAATRSGGQSSNASLEFLRKNPLDLNRASAEQLEILPGIGPAMAARILAYRAENGGFKTVDDLDSVRGIGEKRMETLRPLVKVK